MFSYRSAGTARREIRAAPCGDFSSRRLATKGDEKCGLTRRHQTAGPQSLRQRLSSPRLRSLIPGGARSRRADRRRGGGVHQAGHSAAGDPVAHVAGLPSGVDLVGGVGQRDHRTPPFRCRPNSVRKAAASGTARSFSTRIERPSLRDAGTSCRADSSEACAADPRAPTETGLVNAVKIRRPSYTRNDDCSATKEMRHQIVREPKRARSRTRMGDRERALKERERPGGWVPRQTGRNPPPCRHLQTDRSKERSSNNTGSSCRFWRDRPS